VARGFKAGVRLRPPPAFWWTPTCGLRTVPDPTADNLTPQETTTQAADQVGADQASLLVWFGTLFTGLASSSTGHLWTLTDQPGVCVPPIMLVLSSQWPARKALAIGWWPSWWVMTGRWLPISTLFHASISSGFATSLLPGQDKPAPVAAW